MKNINNRVRSSISELIKKRICVPAMAVVQSVSSVGVYWVDNPKSDIICKMESESVDSDLLIPYNTEVSAITTPITMPVITTTTAAVTTIHTTTLTSTTTTVTTTAETTTVEEISEVIELETTAEPEYETNDVYDGNYLGVYEATWYCATDMGYTSQPYGASGRLLETGYSIASNSIPSGTLVQVVGGGIDGVYRVDDCGGMANNVIDFYYWDRNCVPYNFLNYGRVDIDVYIIG